MPNSRHLLRKYNCHALAYCGTRENIELWPIPNSIEPNLRMKVRNKDRRLNQRRQATTKTPCISNHLSSFNTSIPLRIVVKIP